MAKDEAPGLWGPEKPAALQPCSGEWGGPWLGAGGLATLSLLGPGPGGCLAPAEGSTPCLTQRSRLTFQPVGACKL